MAYRFVQLCSEGREGPQYAMGHAMIWQPHEDLRLRLIVSYEAIKRDFVSVPGAPKYEQAGRRALPHPGCSVREAVERFPGGLAYFNAGEMGLLNVPLIVDGQLVTKPRPARALRQQRWAPLNDDYTFFIQHPDGRVGIRSLPVRDNRLVAPVDKGTYGFAAPYILRGGLCVPLRTPPPGQHPNAREVLFPGGETPAPISALGLTANGEVVSVSLIGDREQPDNLERLPRERDLVDTLRRLNVVDALYTGASGDVQYYDRRTGTLGVGPEREKSPDARWLLREGQTERAVTVVGVLVHTGTPPW